MYRSKSGPEVKKGEKAMSLMTNATSRHTICRIVAFPSGTGRMKEQEIKSNLK